MGICIPSFYFFRCKLTSRYYPGIITLRVQVTGKEDSCLKKKKFMYLINDTAPPPITLKKNPSPIIIVTDDKKEIIPRYEIRTKCWKLQDST